MALSSVTLGIEGMTCGGCAAAVESSLTGLKGVVEASVSLEEKTARVQYRPAQLTIEEILRAVGKAGFRASVKG